MRSELVSRNTRNYLLDHMQSNYTKTEALEMLSFADLLYSVTMPSVIMPVIMGPDVSKYFNVTNRFTAEEMERVRCEHAIWQLRLNRYTADSR